MLSNIHWSFIRFLEILHLSKLKAVPIAQRIPLSCDENNRQHIACTIRL